MAEIGAVSGLPALARVGPDAALARAGAGSPPAPRRPEPDLAAPRSTIARRGLPANTALLKVLVQERAEPSTNAGRPAERLRRGLAAYQAGHDIGADAARARADAGAVLLPVKTSVDVAV